MNLTERCNYLGYIFEQIMDTNSLNEKREIIDDILPEVREDFDYCLTCLAGDVKFGFTYDISIVEFHNFKPLQESMSVKDILIYLQQPMLQKDLSFKNIADHIGRTMEIGDFLQPIVNRTLKLGIGKSILPKSGFAPMLAKKFEDIKNFKSTQGYALTEKLDGNRCIARHNGLNWVFTSRNGKPMNVDFDMSAFDKQYVYDGEVLSPEQTELSVRITEAITRGYVDTDVVNVSFNKTSGLINQHGKNKSLVYNVFDIMVDDLPHNERYGILYNMLNPVEQMNTRLLPILGFTRDADDLQTMSTSALNIITAMGGEGLMINLADRPYEHKRTDGLIKVKKTYTMDMKVVDLEEGSGKYEGLIGALVCEAEVGDRKYKCRVGSGLSDEERMADADYFLGKIVEVAYFSESQNSGTYGTKEYSLRFPRFKRIRHDKSEVSID